MFRRLSSSLPKDPEFPADLEKLGYYINEKDQIRSIAHPDEEFNFFISKNERVREMQRDAFDTCIRNELSVRFEASGLNITRLPLNAGPSDPHVPILTSSNLATANRLIVYFGESMQDLGIFAHRIIGQDSIASGSALDFVHTIQSREDSANTAVIIANLGQLVWYRRGQRAMTIASWNALPRKTGVGNAMRIDAVKNRVPGNGSTKEHVKSVFEDVLGKLAKQDAVIDVIGLGEGAEEAVGYLDQNWEHWERKVKAICVGLGFVWRVGHEIQNKKILDFWGKRARAYLIHNAPVETPLAGRQELSCNCFSSGEPTFTECIMPRSYQSMLEFFQLVNDFPGYMEAELDIPKDEDDMSRVVRWETGIRAESPRAA
ncbi:hypothetical protein IMSHALPRED_009092 [Imshaugia aleurites]|uniref:Arb2 domain-containing protein n=1 Tax=Imshaugia aleurites TaxID=172621 RepID=A0A8H3FYX1_9LECA|nr:hypothetical protein IMSHALPRED_009092 [Imshaugia aleurites]